MPVRYVRHPDLRHTLVEREGVVLHLGTRKYFSVNETGAVLVEALAEPRTREELVRALTDRYEVSADQAGRSVTSFLDRCIAAKLVLVEEE